MIVVMGAVAGFALSNSWEREKSGNWAWHGGAHLQSQQIDSSSGAAWSTYRIPCKIHSWIRNGMR